MQVLFTGNIQAIITNELTHAQNSSINEVIKVTVRMRKRILLTEKILFLLKNTRFKQNFETSRRFKLRFH